MYSKVVSAVIKGINALPVTIETDISNGLPQLTIAGLADTTVREAAVRIRSAIVNSGFDYPMGRITVNISPAFIRKKGTGLDLAMAVGILSASRQLAPSKLQGMGFFGELSLDGTVLPVKGALNKSEAMTEQGVKVVLPGENAEEASIIKGARVYEAVSLKDLIGRLEMGDMREYIHEGLINTHDENIPDYSDVKGQEYAKRALVIAAAGGHGVLMTGSPGTGKSMLASRFPGILPDMTFDEMLETTKIYSASGHLSRDMPLITRRPFRDPHHKITAAGLLGGGSVPMPGEITLASNGVLFLDELAEFDQSVVDTLREPMEKKCISIVRKGETTVFPANFTLIAASNPCKCGYYGDPFHECKCSAGEIARYRSRISGPVLDRIDIHIELMPVSYDNLEKGDALSTLEMREMVLKARERQSERFKGTGVTVNSDMRDSMVKKLIRLGPMERDLMRSAFEKLRLNPRVLVKTLKIARTIADIEGKEEVGTDELSEALQYSRFSRRREGY